MGVNIANSQSSEDQHFIFEFVRCSSLLFQFFRKLSIYCLLVQPNPCNSCPALSLHFSTHTLVGRFI